VGNQICQRGHKPFDVWLTKRCETKATSMTDEPENITLVYLRRLDAKLDQVIETQREHGRKLVRLETELGLYHSGLRR